MRARLPLIGCVLLVSLGLVAPPADAVERPVRPTVTTVWTAPTGTSVVGGLAAASTGPGTATVAWWTDQRPGRRLLVASSPDWRPTVVARVPVAEERDAPFLSRTSVVRGPAGAVVVWSVDPRNEADPRVLYAAAQVDGQWSSPVPLGSARFLTVDDVEADDAGVTVLWSSCDAVCSGGRLTASRLVDGAWSATVLDPASAVREPRLVRDAPDRSTVYWLTRDSIQQSTWLGTQGSPATSVFARATPGLDGSLQADAATDGTTVLSWRATSDRPGWVAAVRQAGAWSSPIPIANVLDTFFPPQVDAVSARGTPTLAASGTSPRCCAQYSVQRWDGGAWVPLTPAELATAVTVDGRTELGRVSGTPWSPADQAKAWAGSGRVDAHESVRTPGGAVVQVVAASPSRRRHLLGVRRLSAGQWGPLLRVTGPAQVACVDGCAVAAPDERSVVLAWTTPRAVRVTTIRP